MLDNLTNHQIGLIFVYAVATVIGGLIIWILLLREDRGLWRRRCERIDFTIRSGFVSAVSDLVRLKDLKEQIEYERANGAQDNQANIDYYERNKEAAWKTVRAYLTRLKLIEHGEEPMSW